ncbi:MAG: hypothetical protein RL006_1089 [Chloroflexota bacterium]|jgi:hypothetical protein
MSDIYKEFGVDWEGRGVSIAEMKMAHTITRLRVEGAASQAEIERLRAKVQEQARLLGMGSEREAKLLARVEVLEKMIATVQNASADSKYLYRDEAINRLSFIRAALKEAKP